VSTDKAGQLLTIDILDYQAEMVDGLRNDWGEKIELENSTVLWNSYYAKTNFKNGKILGYTREHEYTWNWQISLRG